MKKIFFATLALTMCIAASAQENIDELLAAGINDAKRYVSGYLSPAFDGALYSITGGWFNSAETREPFRFGLSIIGSGAIVKDKRKSFLLDTSEYEYLQFQDGSASKNVATLFGNHTDDVVAFVEVDDGMGGTAQVEITLPTGIASTDINIVPSIFIQGSMGLFLGTEVKARFVPPIDYEGAALNLYGLGIQHEFTKWLVPEDRRSVSVSGLIAYTHLDGSYDFTDTAIVAGSDQRFETDLNTWLFQLIASTKITIVNLYGGVGYSEGTSKTDLKGTYMINEGVLAGQSIVDPYSLETNITGIRGTIGASIKLGVVSLNADYTIAEFDNISAGLNFIF
jgi:hypothetical protein